MTISVDDLYRLGYARSFTGFWLTPDGRRIVSEPDALGRATQTLNPTSKPKS